MNETGLKAAIESRIGNTRYSKWTIGITEDCDKRKTEHESDGENCRDWTCWKADTEAIARSVEAYFINQGMKGGTGGVGHPTFVYIF
jgi:hypothetical protein